MYFAPPGANPFSLYPKVQQVGGFVLLQLSNFCSNDNGIVVEHVNGKHLSLLQVVMCFMKPVVGVELLVDRI
jgi:hypothetical protein